MSPVERSLCFLAIYCAVLAGVSAWVVIWWRRWK